MPTQSITNNNGINSMTPVEPVNQSTAPVTAKEFKTKINEYLAEGIKNNLSQDYVARQIESLAREYPDLASKAGLTDYQIIKKGVEKAYQAGAGNRPLALGSASDADLFQLGVRIEADRRIQPKLMTEEEKQALKDTGKEFMTIMALAAGTATGAYLLPTLRALASYTAAEITVFAASPQGQQIAKDALDCLSAMIDESPPPDTIKGTECSIAKIIYKTVKDIEN